MYNMMVDSQIEQDFHAKIPKCEEECFQPRGPKVCKNSWDRVNMTHSKYDS